METHVETEILSLSPKNFTSQELEKPAQILQNGGVLAVPTDTVYGLILTERDEHSIARLNQLKNRPKDQSVITFLPERNAIFRYVDQLPILAERLTRVYWPGPITIIVQDKKQQKRSFRVPGFPLTRELLKLVDDPVLSTSANYTGQPETYEAPQVYEQFAGKIDLILDGGPCPLKMASTVIEIEPAHYQIFREGDVTLEMIEKQRKHKILFLCTGNICRSPMAVAIMQHLLAKHYHLASSEDLASAGFQIESAGLAVSEELPINRKARKTLENLNYPIPTHQSRAVSWPLLQEAKSVYTLTSAHREELLQRWPEFREKVHRLGEKDVADPFGASPQVYQQCAQQIEDYVKKLVEDLCVSP